MVRKWGFRILCAASPGGVDPVCLAGAIFLFLNQTVIHKFLMTIQNFRPTCVPPIPALAQKPRKAGGKQIESIRWGGETGLEGYGAVVSSKSHSENLWAAWP